MANWSHLIYNNTVKECLSEGIPIAVIDLETTGLSCQKEFVFQFAGIKLAVDKDLNATELERLTVFIKPAKPLSPKITQITGFTNADLENEPCESEVFSKIQAFMDGCIMCSHNAEFEKGFLAAMYERNGQKFIPKNILCTVKMSRDLYHGQKHTLSEMAKKYGIDGGVTFHDARDDTEVCAKLLIRLLEEYKEIENSQVNQNDLSDKANITSIKSWIGKRHDMQRIYVNTDYGALYFDKIALEWKEKTKGIIDAIDMMSLESEVLTRTGCHSLWELAKFEGSIQC